MVTFARLSSRTLLCALALVLAGSLAACGSGGGGSSSGTAAGSVTPGSSTSTGTGTAGPTALTLAHQQTALAALGANGTAAIPVTMAPGAHAAWSDMLAMSWPEIRTLIDAAIDRNIRGQVTSLAAGPVRVLALRNFTIDTSAPIGFASADMGPSKQVFEVQLPRSPQSWRIALTADVGAAITQNVFGVPLRVQVSIDVTVEVSDVRVSQTAEVDCTNPARPGLARIASPQVAMRLQLSSTSSFLSQITSTLNAILDPVIRIGLIFGADYARKEILNVIAGAPGFVQPWGLGAAPGTPVAGALPLDATSDEVLGFIRRDHMPTDAITPVLYDTPTYPQGVVTEMEGYGDSPIWTGHYMLGEAMRFDLTGNADAEAEINRAVRGLTRCVDVSSHGAQGDGLLARVAIPIAWPEAQKLLQSPDAYQGTSQGQTYVADCYISRDQYQGALMGLLAAHQRVPSSRSASQALIERMYDFLRRNDWIVFDKPGSRVWARATPYSQTAGGVWAYVRGAAFVNPTKYAADKARFQSVTGTLWFDTWGSTREVHESYYKFNLGTDRTWILYSVETDPAAYRDNLKAHQIERDVTGHTRNAWFDSVYGACVPGAAAQVAPVIKDSLDRWTLRPRRGFATDLTNDPTIQKVFYQSTMVVNTQTGATNPGFWVAKEPVPVEKQPCTDFLWQRNPYSLTGWDDPRMQYPGVDLTLPLWLAKSYGMLP